MSNLHFKNLLKGKAAPATEAAMQMDIFVRRFEPRKVSNLVMPPLPLMNNFEFPRNSTYHFVSLDALVKGPSENDPRLAKITKKMSVEHVREYSRAEGNPVRTSVEVQGMIDAWSRMQKRFRKSRDTLEETASEEIPAIFNYGMLPHLYRYMASVLNTRYKWLNTWTTVFDKIASKADSDRTNFVFITLPQRLPSIRRMEECMEKQPAALVRMMDDQDQWMILELFKWLHRSRRHETIFSSLKPEQLQKIEIVVEDAGRFLLLNMGKLDLWLENPAVEPQRGIQIYDELKMKRAFMGGLIALLNTRNPESASEENIITTLDDEGKPVQQLPEEKSVINDQTEPQQTQIGDVNTQEMRLQQAESDLDKDLAYLETLDNIPASKDVSIGATGVEIIEGVEALSLHNNANLSIQDTLMQELDNIANSGAITFAEHRRLANAVAKSENMASPYDPKATAKEYSRVDLEETIIKDVPVLRDDHIIQDKSLLKNSLKNIDKDYIRKTLPRDKVASVLAIQKAGYIVTSLESEIVTDALGSYEDTSISITPLRGKSSTHRIKQVVIDDDARIRTGNTEYTMRAQSVDNPCRKTGPAQVTLASYYGKTFINRSEKTVNDYGKWLTRLVNANLFSDKPTITKAYTENVFRNEAVVPRAYSAMAQQYRSFEVEGVTYYFDYNAIGKNFPEAEVKRIQSLGMVPIGKKGESIYAIDTSNTIYDCSNGDAVPLQSFGEVLGGDPIKAPEEFAECRILGENIPAGLVLGSFVGLSALMRDLKVTPRQVTTGSRLNLQAGEWSLAFEDVTYVFSRDDQLPTMVLAGLKQFESTLKRFPVRHFDNPDVYYAVLQSMGLGNRHAVEIEMLGKLFVDPMTERKLREMGAPLTYPELVKYACEMLINDRVSRPRDQNEQRIRRAERLAGNLYTELVNGIRMHKYQGNRPNAKLDIKPYAVWQTTMKDGAIIQVKDINPLHALKEVHAVTVSGNGGRSGRAFTRANRAKDITEDGTTSEATVDSKDVGITYSSTASPRFSTMQGTPIVPKPGEKIGMGEMLSITGICSPFITNDDIKRANFATIQASHAVSCPSYMPSIVMTGAEATIAERVHDSFASTAETNGVVKSITEFGVVIEHKDGSSKHYTLGRRQGKAAGQIIPHDLVTDLKVGDRVQAGDVVSYHKGWFKRDNLNPKRYYWMAGTTVCAAFLESRKTHEDACSISKSLSARLGTEFSETKHLTVRFDQHIHDLVKIGQAINHGDPYCFLEDDTTHKANVFSSDSLNTLKALSGNVPVAKVSGMIDDIEVFYNGELQDMSQSLQAIAEAGDKRRRQKLRERGQPVHTGFVPEGYRIEGEPLLPNTMDIVIHISRHVGAGVADKGVVGLQLKTEISEVYSYPVTTPSGMAIDLIFGGQSVYNRIVMSAIKTGSVNTNSIMLSKAAGNLFFGE